MRVRVFTSMAFPRIRAAWRIARSTLPRRLVCMLVASGVLIGMTACASPAAPPASTLMPVTVQLSWSHQAEFAGLYAADRQGYFAAEGLQVSFVEGGPEVDFIARGGKPASSGVPFLSTGRNCGASSMNQIKSTC